jgi:hypothetical protein
MHHIQLQRPEELRMMVREMTLGRIEQLFLRIASELRPALTVGDPPVTIAGQVPARPTRHHRGLRPAENVCVSDPGFHAWQDHCRALSIRFQIVAGRCLA